MTLSKDKVMSPSELEILPISKAIPPSVEMVAGN